MRVNLATRFRMIAVIAAFVLSLTVIATPSVASAQSSSTKPLPVKFNFFDALAFGVINGGKASPPGANDWSCKPTAEHPRPVVLVHATLVTMGINWNALSPMLKNEGHCVFALNYGGKPLIGLLGAYGPLADSAMQLSDFVDQVLAATGATEVDLVGHSQGGTMPRYYIKNLGGDAKVANLVGLAPSNHGTDFNGLVAILEQYPGWAKALADMCGACIDQMTNSEFMNALNAGGETSPNVNYTVITTKFDTIVTPYTSSFLAEAPNVKNITVQDVCRWDFTEHLGIAYDHVALQLVMNAIDPAHAKKPSCSIFRPVLPIIGG